MLSDKLYVLVNAVKAGESLNNPEVWKNSQVLMNAILAFVSCIPLVTNIELSEVQMNFISYGLAGGVGIINMYITTATTRKIGLKLRK